MPRVKTATRKRAIVKRPMICRHCSEEIMVGDSYYTWQKRYGGPQFTHTKCGLPKPTMLSDRKTAQIEEAIGDLDLTAWSPELPENWDGDIESLSFDYDDVITLLSDIASTARDVGSEYEASADNMPESLQYGTQAEAMREVAQELESWADDLESFDAQRDEPDLPERDETPDGEESLDDYRDRVQDALNEWADEVRSEAEDKLGDVPEYQG